MQVTAPASMTPPVRSITQRFDALRLANEKRAYRSEIKRQLKTRQLGIFDAIDDPKCDTMRVYDVLVCIPNMGRTKVDLLFEAAHISHSKTCAGISTQQRMRLANVLASRHPHMPIVFRAPEHGSVLVARTMEA